MPKTIGLTGFAYPHQNGPNKQALFDELKTTYGWSETATDPNKQITIVYDDRTSGKTDDKIAEELVAKNPDVILASGFRIHHTINATSTIPIIMAPATGYPEATVFNRPTRPTNVTGMTIWRDGIAKKRVAILHGLLPVGHDRIATLRNATKVNSDSMLDYNETRNNLPSLPTGDSHPDWTWSEKHDVEDRLDKYFDKQPEHKRAHALIVISDFPAYWRSNRVDVIDMINRRGLKTMYPNCGYTEEGGLMAYGPDLLKVFKRLAYYVDKALCGQAPANTWEWPSDDMYRLCVNTKIAQQVGLEAAVKRLPSELNQQVTFVENWLPTRDPQQGP